MSSSKKVLAVILAIGAIALGVALARAIPKQALQFNSHPSEENSDGVGSSFVAPEEPSRIKIPSIGIDAAVQKVGLTASGDMGIPSNYTDVAWYKDGPRPGAPGSAVIDGHVTGKGGIKAVFYKIETLKVGDEVEVVDSAGKSFTFKVVRTKLYERNASSEEVFLDNSGKTLLNLITCDGDWLPDAREYSKRLVVFTELVK